MGCVRSTCGTPDPPVSEWGGAPVCPGADRETSGVDVVLLEYAQRLSEDIVTRAVRQWAEVDRRYCDIPYIECDVP